MARAIELYLANPAGALLEDDEIELPEEYNDFCIMREMGWDWWTFQAQPDFYIKEVKAFMFAEQQAKQARRLAQDENNHG